ncbi:MAG: bifunctional 5,10-methylenetetrahydrofolate dehydrogenase/5,10-methenyltetrahydrofolate cyclohydrolase [Bdellovibrionia bacterium]
MEILNGKVVAEHLLQKVKLETEVLMRHGGRRPHLTVIIVGNDRASEIYVSNKKKACEKIGMSSDIIALPAMTTTQELVQLIATLNSNPQVDGILVQLPLPKTINSSEVLSAITPNKDVDCFGSMAMGKVFSGQAEIYPCTPAGVIKICEYYKLPLKGKNAVVVGKSNIVGKPMAVMLLDRGATVTVCHSKTEDLKGFTRQADIVVVAAGVPHLLTTQDFKKGAVVIDVGIHRQENKIIGDVLNEGADDHLAAMTPVPGGVGPMTIACLLENTLTLSKKNQGR